MCLVWSIMPDVQGRARCLVANPNITFTMRDAQPLSHIDTADLTALCVLARPLKARGSATKDMGC